MSINYSGLDKHIILEDFRKIILARPTQKCCVLLRIGRLCFLMPKFSKNKRRACDHRDWLLESPQAPLLNLTAKSGAKLTSTFPARLLSIKNLRIKKHSQLSDRSDTSSVPLVGWMAQCTAFRFLSNLSGN